MRQRGDEAPNHLAAVQYLKGLEREMEKIRKSLDEAWLWLDSSKSFRHCSRHMDHAQQRMHKVIKKLERRRRLDGHSAGPRNK